MFNFLYTSNLVTIFVFRLFGYCSGKENNSEQAGIRQPKGERTCWMLYSFRPTFIYLFGLGLVRGGIDAWMLPRRLLCPTLPRISAWPLPNRSSASQSCPAACTRLYTHERRRELAPATRLLRSAAHLPPLTSSGERVGKREGEG